MISEKLLRCEKEGNILRRIYEIKDIDFDEELINDLEVPLGIDDPEIAYLNYGIAISYEGDIFSYDIDRLIEGIEEFIKDTEQRRNENKYDNWEKEEDEKAITICKKLLAQINIEQNHGFTVYPQGHRFPQENDKIGG